MTSSNPIKKYEFILALAEGILNDCRNLNIDIRLLGSVALLFLDKSKNNWLFEHRKQFNDIDFVVHSNDISQLEHYFQELGFENNRSVKMLHGNKRRNFSSPENISVDFFIGNISLCQNILVLDRLHLSYPTITTTDLFLTKIQKQVLTDKDIFDINYILNFEIDDEYIIDLCSNDWRWWKTLQVNISFLYNADLSNKNKLFLKHILSLLTSKKKSLTWKVRDVFGASIKWYNDVEE